MGVPPAGGGAPWRPFCGMGRCLPLVGEQGAFDALCPSDHLAPPRPCCTLSGVVQRENRPTRSEQRATEVKTLQSRFITDNIHVLYALAPMSSRLRDHGTGTTWRPTVQDITQHLAGEDNGQYWLVPYARTNIRSKPYFTTDPVPPVPPARIPDRSLELLAPLWPVIC
jgi:hypothetical protein